MPRIVTLEQLREVLQTTMEELVAWFVAKPRVLSLPHPEQQIQFELAARLREHLRDRTDNPSWDRLYFDGATIAPSAFAGMLGRHPPIFVDSRQLFGSAGTKSRSPSEPDLAVAVHVIRAAEESIRFDSDGNPLGQAWLPTSIRAQGFILDARVAQLERLSHQCCDCALLVIYSNESKRSTAIESREVCSWASWQKPLDTLWWTLRHFRAKARPA